MMTIRSAVLTALVALLCTACASTGAEPRLGMTATTLTAGWEQHFRIEWAAAEQGQNQNVRTVSGYVYNQNGESAMTLRVLAQAVDATGSVVGQRVAFVPGGVGGFGRVYFEVPNLPVAATYRVIVWDYAWFQADGDDKQ
jgi:hypothetical protein